MNFEYSDDHKILQKTVRNLFENKVSKSVIRDFMEDKKLPIELKNTLAQQGLLSIIEDEENGDGIIYSTLILYEAGRALVPFPLVESHAVSYLLTKLKEINHAEALSEGKEMYTVAWETDSSIGERSGNTFKVSGHFSSVPFAADSNYITAKVNMGKHGGNTIILIDSKDSSVQMTEMQSMDETYPLYEVELKDYELKDTYILGEVGKGDELFREIEDVGRLLLSAEMIGSCEKVMYETVDYTNERVQFGQPISKFQAVKHSAAEMYLQLESSRAALKYATCAMTSALYDGDPVISILKSHVSKAANDLIGTSIQLHGGIGFTWESDIHLYFKRTRRNSVSLGDHYYHNERCVKFLEQQINASEPVFTK